MKLKLILQATAATFVFAATTFAANPAKDIVGKWADADGAENIEYKADGTFSEAVGGEVIKGKFSFPDATHIKVEFDGPMSAMGAMVSAIAIKGDEMDITGPDGSAVMHYKRQK